MEGKKNHTAARSPWATRGRPKITCALLFAALHSAPSAALVGPRVGATTFEHNTCTGWAATTTLVASELNDEELKDLMTYPGYTFRHMHELGGEYGYGTERVFRSDTTEGRLGEINRWLYGTENPKIGQAVVKSDGHNGDCPSSHNDPPECFGVLLGYASMEWDPRSRPPPNVGGCKTVPPTGNGCKFTLPVANLDVGAVQAGSSKETSMTVVYECPSASIPAVVDLGGGGSRLVDKKAGVSADIKIGGSELPIKLSATSQGRHELKLDITIRSGPDGSGPFSAAGILEIAPQ